MGRRLSPQEQARIRRIAALENQLRKIVLQTFTLTLSLPQLLKALREADELFELKRNRIAFKKIQTILKNQFSKFNFALLNGIEKEFQITNDDLWKTIEKRKPKQAEQLKVFETIRNEAQANVRSIAEQARTFTNEKKGGMTISERVWKTFQNIPKEIDVMVQNSIKQGSSAADLAKNLNKYLLEDDRLYRKVPNKKTGILEWSKAAKEYRPGQGVYRSSYKNALRLARTEINRAYREAEWNAFQDNLQIVGYEIVLSNNTENQCDVCKKLAGTYPIWFKWTGWHPQCRCRMIAIPLPPEEFQRLTLLTLQGKRDSFKPKVITDIPVQLKDYLSTNKDRIDQAASVPYWYEDNRKVLEENSV